MNVQLVKHDIVIAVIYYYITTEFHYTKRDSAYGGVMYGENANRHFERNFDTLIFFLIEITDLNANTSMLVC